MSKSQAEIRKTDISDIIRLSYALAPTWERPDPGNQDFPVLTCNFKGIGQKLRGIELVDLPGLGDINVDDMEIEEIYRIATQSCHGTIMVISTLTNTIISDRIGHKAGQSSHKGNPLAVICTGSDQHNKGEEIYWWKEDKKLELRRLIFKSPESSECRFLFCSPPLYRSSRHLIERIEEAEKNRTRVDYDDAWQNGGELCMDKDFSGKFGRKNWNGCDYDELKEAFESRIEKSQVNEIPGLLYRTLEVEALDKRYLDIMSDVRKYLKLLCEKQQIMLEHSNSNRQAMEAAKKRCSDFTQDSYDLMMRWEIKGQEFLRRRMEELEDILASAERQAGDRLERAVKFEAIGVKYRSINPSTLKIEDVTMQLADQAEAARFLFDIDNQVRAELDKLQDEIVVAVRNTAKTAWEGRIRALGKFFQDHELDMPDIEALRDELVSKLQKKSQEDIATALAELVESQIHNQKQPRRWKKLFFRRQEQPFMARSLATRQALDWSIGKSSSKSSSENDEAIEAKLTSVSHLQKPGKALSAADAEDLHTKGVNYLGYLIRAPVSGNVAECQINAKIWTFLKDSKKSIKPVEVKVSTVLDKYRELVVRGWAEIVQNDSRTSLRGAILLSAGIAKKIVVEALDNHLVTLNEAENAMARPMDPADEENLILMQTDFTAAFAASDYIHQLLTAECDKASKTAL